jgi:hypothetical protein
LLLPITGIIRYKSKTIYLLGKLLIFIEREIKMKKKLILFFVLLLPAVVESQTNFKDLQWLVGRWKLNNSNFEFYEEWKQKNEMMIEGISYSLNNGKKEVSERLLIQQIYNYVSYIALPGNNVPTLFTLVSGENNKFIFENKEHDFPTRLIYEKIGINSLTARAEGYENGKFKELVFVYKKVE